MEPVRGTVYSGNAADASSSAVAASLLLGLSATLTGIAGRNRVTRVPRRRCGAGTCGTCPTRRAGWRIETRSGPFWGSLVLFREPRGYLHKTELLGPPSGPSEPHRELSADRRSQGRGVRA
jgi:hypothetical protein